MNSGVAIVGAVQTKYEARKDHQAYNELVYEVVAALLKQTGVRMQEVDSMITASQDFYDGKTISAMSVNEVVGAYLKSEAKVAGDGMQALIYGAARVMSGTFDYTLVVAHCKESECNPHVVTSVMFDPYCERPLGMNEAIAAGLQARRYLEATGLGMDALARVAQKNFHAAKKNPLAVRRGEYSVEQILKAPQFADPLTELMVAPFCDGACALLLASPAKAKAFGERAVWITGMGNSTDAYWNGRDLAQANALKQAAERAYAAAGVTADQIDVAEVSARFAHEELLYGEALGLWNRNELAALTNATNPLRKHTKVNPSGGPLAGNPVTVAGLARAAEAYAQLSGTAGERQVAGAKTAVAHGAGGICGQSQAVVILQKGEA